MSEGVTLTIDGAELTVPDGTLVIRAAEQLGITIPRFCDHPLLEPVAACRQCLVEVDGRAKPFTSCSTMCTEGMQVRTHQTSQMARQAQEGQLELLLVNHPLDCPQCDKGGECPLQDQALSHGPGDSRFVDKKRRYEKPVPISPLVALDRERCVLCARCTRFSQQISGDPFIELFERGALEQVSIYEDDPYDSYFSGNVIQICPVGALTATSYRFASRPFDLRSVNGVCNQCSAGCNLRVDVRSGELQRQLARQNMAVNEEWNCDKGRFGFEYVASEERLRSPLARDDEGALVPVPWRAGVRRAGEAIRQAAEDGPEAVGVLAGGRLTDEDAYAVGRFAGDVVGTDSVDHRMRPRTDEELGVLSAVAGTVGPTYDELERADLVIVAGLDPEEEVPILHLRLRKAWRRHHQKIVAVGPVLGSMREIAWRWVRTEAGDEARVLSALAADDAGEQAEGLADVAEALSRAGLTAVVLAGERLAESPGGLPAAAELARARELGFAWVPRRANARGAVDAGLVPGLLPGGRWLAEPGPVAESWGQVPRASGMDTRQMLAAAAEGRIRALYLVGVDPARDFEDPRLAKEALEQVETLVVQDLLPTETTRYADVVLPAAAAQERVGSFTTWEGRRQPFPQAVPPQGHAQEDWDLVAQLAAAMGSPLGWETAADVRAEAAPLMEVPVRATERLSARPAESGGAAVSGSDDEGQWPLAAVVLERLIGEGSMLTGAKALKETGRDASVWVSTADAAQLGLADRAHVAVVGPGGRYELPATVTDTVASGCVVLPGPSTFTAPGVLAAPQSPPAGPQRVRLETDGTLTGGGSRVAASGDSPGGVD
jgi:NADH-quinone oxidoreductase subunit G